MIRYLQVLVAVSLLAAGAGAARAQEQFLVLPGLQLLYLRAIPLVIDFAAKPPTPGLLSGLWRASVFAVKWAADVIESVPLEYESTPTTINPPKNPTHGPSYLAVPFTPHSDIMGCVYKEGDGQCYYGVIGHT